MRKYGVDNFESSILFESDSWGELVEKEIALIASHKTKFPQGYNLTIGGEGSPGAVVTESTRRKQSENMRRRLEDPIISAKNKENFAKASAKRKEVWDAKTDDEKAVWCRQHSERMKPKLSSPEVRAKMSAGQRGCKRPWSDERKNRTKESGNYKFSDEKKQLFSDNMKRIWAERKARKGIVDED